MDDITETLEPKSEQLDAIELVGGPRTFTVERVVVKKGAEQPVSVYFAEFPRPWRPGKNQRRVLAYCWGKQSSGWVGKRVTLFYDPEVVYGGKNVGGARISHLSHIDGPKDAPVLLSQGRPGTYRVEPMPTEQPTKDWNAVVATAAGITDLDTLGQLWRNENVGSAPQEIRDAISARGDEIKAADQ